LFILADKDPYFPETAIDTTREIISQKTGLQVDIQEFPGMPHGFAIRGTKRNPTIKEARKQAFDMSVDFLRKSLSLTD